MSNSAHNSVKQINSNTNKPIVASSTSKILSKLEEEVDQLQKKNDIDETQRLEEITKKSEKSIPVPVPAKPKEVKQTTKLKKELDSVPVSFSSPETVSMREISMDLEPALEVAEFMEVKPDPHTVTIPEPVEDDEYTEMLLKATQIPEPNIILPIGEQELEKAFHHKIIDSVRWLAEWTKRIILQHPKRVFFKK